MFGDTISLGGKTYSKINQDQYGSVYRYLDVAYEARITVRHSSRIDASRNRIRIDRHNIEWSIRSFGVSGAPDQLQKVYLVGEYDYNVSVADAASSANALMTTLQASSNALLLKLCNWES